MSKLEIAIAGAVSLLLLSSCGSKEAAVTDNSAVAETRAPADSVSAESPNIGVSDAAADPVPPPDAVSHPDGYLPPAPDSPAANSSGPGAPPPATEDQYIRNGQ